MTLCYAKMFRSLALKMFFHENFKDIMRVIDVDGMRNIKNNVKSYSFDLCV